MTVHDIAHLVDPELSLWCARLVMGWDQHDPACCAFGPCVSTGHALLLVERLGPVDFVLKHCPGVGHSGAFWMAWFGDASQATADTPARAICRAALLYVLERGVPPPGTLRRQGPGQLSWSPFSGSRNTY
jgi:hypothetical protein